MGIGFVTEAGTDEPKPLREVLKLVEELNFDKDLLTSESYRIKKARLKLSWLESYIYDCLQLENKRQKSGLLEVDLIEFCANYRFMIGKNLDKNALTTQSVAAAINSIQKKEGLLIEDAPEVIQLRLF
jgi:hypothetical protein